MDAVAGAGGMFGQLAVGIAGGVPDGGGTMPGFNNAVNKLNKIGQKPTIDSLPDKVCNYYSISTNNIILLFFELSYYFFSKYILGRLSFHSIYSDF